MTIHFRGLIELDFGGKCMAGVMPPGGGGRLSSLGEEAESKRLLAACRWVISQGSGGGVSKRTDAPPTISLFVRGGGKLWGNSVILPGGSRWPI